MFISILYLSILYLEAFSSVFLGTRLNAGLPFSLSKLLFKRKYTLQTKVNTISKPGTASLLDKIFILITDHWFFRWLRKKQGSPLSLKNKTENPKLILNDHMTQVKVSYLSNNVKYTGQSQKKYIC